MNSTRLTLAVVCIGVGILTSMVGTAGEEYDKKKFSSYKEFLRSKTPLRKRLDDLIVPKCSFEKVELNTVIEFIRHKAKELDPEAAGFNVFYQCKKEALTQKITLEMENVPVRDLLRFACLAAQTRVNFKIEKHAVVIFDRGLKEKVNQY